MPETIQEAIQGPPSSRRQFTNPAKALPESSRLPNISQDNLATQLLPIFLRYSPSHLVVHMQDNMDEYKVLIEDLPEEMN